MRDKIRITKHTIPKLERRAQVATITGFALAALAALFCFLALKFNLLNIYQVVYLTLPVIFLCTYLIGLLDADFIIYKNSLGKESPKKEDKEVHNGN